MTDLQDYDIQHAATVPAAPAPAVHVEPVDAGAPPAATVTPPAAPAAPTESTTKRCHKCGIEKPVSDYWKNVSSKDGLQAQCKPCLSERNRKSAASRGPGRPAGSSSTPAPAPAIAPAPAAPGPEPMINLALVADAIGLLRGYGIEEVEQSRLLKLLNALDLPGIKTTGE